MAMVDIGKKAVSVREAVVVGKITMKPKVLVAIRKKKLPKGDALSAAKLAGILAAKNTPTLIPLCHPIPIDYTQIEFTLGKGEIGIKSTVRAAAKTGVEMEAFTATAVAGLTIYDMCKPLDRAITISDIKLFKKSGGKSETYKIN